MKNIRFLLTKMNSLTSAEEVTPATLSPQTTATEGVCPLSPPQVGKSCLEMCLNVVVISMAMVRDPSPPSPPSPSSLAR